MLKSLRKALSTFAQGDRDGTGKGDEEQNTVRDDSEESRTEAREHLLNLGVDGVIVVAWTEAMMELALDFAKELPTCVVAEDDVPAGLARVHSDHVSGARQATEALLGAGRRRIGHLSGPATWSEAQSRVSGWREAGGDACGHRLRVFRCFNVSSQHVARHCVGPGEHRGAERGRVAVEHLFRHLVSSWIWTPLCRGGGSGAFPFFGVRDGLPGFGQKIRK